MPAPYRLYPSIQEPPFGIFTGPGPTAMEWFMPLSEPSAFLAPRGLPTQFQQFFIHQLLAVFVGYGSVMLHAKHDEIIELSGKLEKGTPG